MGPQHGGRRAMSPRLVACPFRCRRSDRIALSRFWRRVLSSLIGFAARSSHPSVMPLRARISASAVHQKGGRIARELNSLLEDDKAMAHKHRLEEVVTKMKGDLDLTQRIYTCVSKQLLSGEAREEDPDFGPKLTAVGKVPKAFLKSFLQDLAPDQPMSAATWKAAGKAGGADLPVDILCLVCRVEKKDFLGPSNKKEWMDLFQKRHAECGSLYRHFAKDPGHPKKFYAQHGHYRLLPAPAKTAPLEDHIYKEICCHGLTALLPKSVRVSGAWTIKKNYSLEEATICDDDDFSFSAADCFKKTEGFADLRSVAWLTVYDKRGKKKVTDMDVASSVGADVAGSIGALEDEGPPEQDFPSDESDSEEVRRPAKRAKTVAQCATPIAKERAPPASTPDKLAMVRAALGGEASVSPADGGSIETPSSKLGVS